LEIGLEHRLRTLMLRARAGDASAWRELLGDLRVRLEAYFARRLVADLAAEADDLVQETLIAMHARAVTYDPGQPFTAWAYAIARYKLIDLWRRKGVRRHVALEDFQGELFGPDGHAAAEAALDVDRLLGGLPVKQQGLVRDVKLEGLSLAEAGARRGMTEGAAKVSLHRALKQLMGKVGDRADG
jgi:RNA polymerase sigma-70 factor, ECF subfamily